MKNSQFLSSSTRKYFLCYLLSQGPNLLKKDPRGRHWTDVKLKGEHRSRSMGGPGRARPLAHVNAEAGHCGRQGGAARAHLVPTPSPPTTSSHCDVPISAVTSNIQTWTPNTTVTSGISLLCGPRVRLAASSTSSLTGLPYVSPTALSLQSSHSSAPLLETQVG